MASIDITNPFDGWLVVWIEPLGEDHWLRPGETCHITDDYAGSEEAFEVDHADMTYEAEIEIHNVVCWVIHFDLNMRTFDANGVQTDCGHQRPVEIALKWEADRLQWEAERRAAAPGKQSWWQGRRRRPWNDGNRRLTCSFSWWSLGDSNPSRPYASVMAAPPTR